MSKKRLENVEEIRPVPEIKKVKVYDVDTAMKKWTKNNKKGQHCVHGPGMFALIEGKEKVILVDQDAVHWIFNKDNIEHKIDVAKYAHGKFSLFSDMVASLNNEMLDNMEPTEMELGKFVRRFGDRIENNYFNLLQSITEIGFDPDNYPRGEIEREPLAKKRLDSI